MNKIEAIFSDLDGTLLNEHHVVSPYNQEVIQAAWDAGIPFHVVTGRSSVSIRSVEGLKPRNLVCSFNGCKVENFDTGEYLYQIGIDIADNQALIHLAQDHGFTVIWYCGDTVYTNKDDELSQSYFGIGGLNHEVSNLEDFAQKQLTKIVFRWHNEEELNKAYAQIENDTSLNLWGTYALDNSLEILSKDANKGVAVRFIAQKNGYNLKNCMAFGDNANDVPMLKAVGHPVVMENGRKSAIKQFANMARPNSEDGVGKYIKSFLNI